MLTRGTAFFYDDHDHVWFVLSNPNHKTGKVLCVNFTTPGGLCADNECFVDPTDYPWLTHQSVIAFSRAKIGDVAILNRCLADGILKQPKPDCVSTATVEMVAKAGKLSKELSPEKKAFLD